MEQLNILPDSIFKFECDENLTAKVYEHVVSLYPERFFEDSRKFQLSLDYYHDELFQFFDASILKLKDKFFKDDLSLPIIDAWINRYPVLTTSRPHTHHNSFVSGIFYLTSHENDGATRFSKTNSWFDAAFHKTEHNLLTPYKNIHEIHFDFYPKAGTLLLFPSHLLHSTTATTKSKTTRYTIAFNCFPSGPISTGETTRFTMSALSLKDKLGK